jgi:uncharacterized protein
VIQRYLHFCWEHPQRLITMVSALTVLLAFSTFGRLDFDANREALFKASPTEQRRKLEFEQRFGSWKELVLVVEGGTSRERERVVDTLAEFLSESPLAEDVRGRVELPGVEKLGLYFLSVEELQDIDQALTRYGSVLSRMSQDGWYGFLEFVQSSDGLDSTPSEQRKRFAEVWEQAVDGRGRGALDGIFPRVDLPQQSYYLDGRKRHLILFRSEEPMAIRQAIRQVSKQLGFAGRVVMTGQPLLQAEERHETIRDAVASTLLSIFVIQIILVWGFRETARPRLAFLSLVFGLFWSVAWAAVVVGNLNIITINFLSITVGLGIDFSIHILARYAEERLNFESSVLAMEKTLRTTGRENLVGAVATSLAFWALVLTDFRAVKELGYITGFAVPLCFVSVVALLPPLLFWREKNSAQGEAVPFEFQGGTVLVGLETGLRRHPRRWLILLTVVILGMGFVGAGVQFDYNLLNMQSANSEAVRYEREGGFNSLSAFVVADSPAEARELKEKLTALSAVSEVQTIAEMLPGEVDKKRPLVASIVTRAKQLELPEFDPAEKTDWGRMEGLASGLQDPDVSPEWVTYLHNSGPGPVEDVWRQMQGHLKQELTDTISRLRRQDPDFEIQSWKERAPDIRRLSSPDGKTLLRVRSKGSLWEREVLVEFLDQVGSVTDKGIGPPFLVRGYLEQLRESYFDAVRYAILAIVVLLALHFRALLPTLIALVPKVAGAVGMFFAMACAGIDLNPANCMALPLTLGIGLVFGIHAVHRCLETPDTLLIQGATGKAIALSGWTTIASFGTLMSASHPGIFSLGFVMASGVAANMLATFLLVPPLVVVFRERLVPPGNIVTGDQA